MSINRKYSIECGIFHINIQLHQLWSHFIESTLPMTLRLYVTMKYISIRDVCFLLVNCGLSQKMYFGKSVGLSYRHKIIILAQCFPKPDNMMFYISHLNTWAVTLLKISKRNILIAGHI